LISWIFSANERRREPRCVCAGTGNERALDLAEEFKEDLEIPFDIVSLESGEAYR